MKNKKPSLNRVIKQAVVTCWGNPTMTRENGHILTKEELETQDWGANDDLRLRLLRKIDALTHPYKEECLCDRCGEERFKRKEL